MIKHGLSRTKLYKIWASIKTRCYNIGNEDYNDYGGRGIEICKEWINNPAAFCEWANQNGYKSGLSIDRIDVEGNYEPSNCRWITMKEQQRNKRNTIYVTANGQTLTIGQWADKLGIAYDTLRQRHAKGWSDDKIVNTPQRITRRSK